MKLLLSVAILMVGTQSTAELIRAECTFSGPYSFDGTTIVNALRYPTRNHTIVALSFYAGLRACEIAALRVGDVFDEAGGVKDTRGFNSPVQQAVDDQ